MRFPLEVFDAMRDAMADEVPLLVRFSGTDWRDDIEGWSTEDSVTFARELESRGCDGVDVSTGGNAKAEIPGGPGFQVPFAAAVKQGVESMPVIAVGELDDPRLAEDGTGRPVGVRGSVRMVRREVTGVRNNQNTSSPMAIQAAATTITNAV
jgi:2,4-dienoyl-CoA reductase-like NADH-dependent reductase (Old Yellow Enzyme family)